MRRAVVAAAAAGLFFLGAPAPAAPPEPPATFIKVEELKGLLDRGPKADIIDVRVWYALGNLVYDQTWSTKTMEGVTLEKTFEGETLRQVRMLTHLILDK